MLWRKTRLFLPKETINLLEENTSAWAQKNTSVSLCAIYFFLSAFLSPLTVRCPGVGHCSKLLEMITNI